MTGPLWISEIAGSRTLALTPNGVSASFAGMTGDPLNGTGTVYYVTDISDDAAAIYRIRFPAGAPEHVLDFTPWDARFATASLSPDGRYVAYTDRYGLQRLDLQTYGVLQLAAGNPDPNCDARSCLTFSRPAWSPDGSLITASETFYEKVAKQVVIDPFSPGSDPIKIGTFCGDWSADSKSICTTSDLEGGGSGLHVASKPDWTIAVYLATFKDPVGGAAASVDSCSWLTPTTLAISLASSGNYPNPDYTYTAVFDLARGAVTRLDGNPPGEQCCFRTRPVGFLTQGWCSRSTSYERPIQT